MLLSLVPDFGVLLFLPPTFVDQLLKMKAAVSDLSSRSQVFRGDQTFALRFKQCLYVLVVTTKSYFSPVILNPGHTLRPLGNLKKIPTPSPRWRVSEATEAAVSCHMVGSSNAFRMEKRPDKGERCAEGPSLARSDE